MMAANIGLPTQLIPHSVSTVSSVPTQRSFSDPSQDIGLNILAFVPTLDLAATPCVNRSWRDLTNDNQVWTDRLSQDERDNFAALVEEKCLSWKEACLYTPLSHFVSNIVKAKLSDSIRLQKNPTLSNQPTLAPSVIPGPYIQYGKYSFAICNLTNIEMQEEGNPITTLFENERGLLHLAVDGDFLFALRRGGTIIQWNYKTKKDFKEISTHLESSHYGYYEFYAKDGYIIINSSEIGRRDSARLEIIPYQDLTERQLIDFTPNVDLPFSKILITSKQIIGAGGSSLLIKNRSNHETKTYQFASLIRGMNLHQHILYVVDSKRKVYKIDLQSVTLNETFASLASDEMRVFPYNLSTVVNHLAFIFLHSKKLVVEDLRSGEEEILLEDQSQNIHDAAAYKADLLKKFIKRVKRKPSSYPRLAKIFRSILKSEFLRDLIKSVYRSLAIGLALRFCIVFFLAFFQEKLAAKQ